MALQHEENRCGYLDSQKGMMTAIHEEMATMPEGKDQLTLPKLLWNCKFSIFMEEEMETRRSYFTLNIFVDKYSYDIGHSPCLVYLNAL